MRHFININQDFRCLHCHAFVTVDRSLSAVNNRNHCPYCLWTRDLDLFEAGDRLSACKGGMRPVGLTLKERHKKYGTNHQGELMLVHCCTECGKVAINRIAADDFIPVIVNVYQDSNRMSNELRFIVQQQGITLLTEPDEELVRHRLFGNGCGKMDAL